MFFDNKEQGEILEFGLWG